MYSPKIREDLIPKLYRLAKARKQPMTTLVNDLIEESLVGEEIPETAEEIRRKWSEEKARKRKEASVRRLLRQLHESDVGTSPNSS